MKAHPFLKWAGGKRKLIPELLKHVHPSSYHTYFEPFLGGGSLFFELEPKDARLSDLNPDLVKAYLVVRDEVEKLITQLHKLEGDHRKTGLNHYLKIRKAQIPPWDYLNCAARMIYLNKTCFNGLWRVNIKGNFNVPMGRFKTPPTICDVENLRACSKALWGVNIDFCDYKRALSYPAPRKGDFVYLDPPYVPLSSSSNFTAYTKQGFGPQDQKDLATYVNVMKKRGIHFLLSNAGNKTVEDLYPTPPFEISKVAMRRNINCVAGDRGDVCEYLIT